MNKRLIGGIAILLGVTIVPIAGMFGYDAYLARNVDAEIIARAPERGNFQPRTVVVPAGEQVQLRVRNVDTVTHGFAIPALGVDAGAINAGHVKWLTFTPEKPGTYRFYCTVWCSTQHLQMYGNLKVVQK